MALIVGGFYVKSCEFTKSWGIEPASSSGIGVIHEGSGDPLAVGDYVVMSMLGVNSYGIVSSLERVRSREAGDEWSFQIVDNRIRLRWAVVFGQWNMPEEPWKVHTDSLPIRGSALDLWKGDTIAWDQGVDFVGGIESEMGNPQPLSEAGSASRGRWYSHIAPGNWASHTHTYSQGPRSAAQILQEAAQGAKGGGAVGFTFHSAQDKPVFSVDCNSGVTLAALIQQIAESQGLQVTLDNWNTLRFERRGAGTVVVPPNSYVARAGMAISTDPTKVRIVGGRRLVQVNEVPLVPDWKSGWEKFLDETLWWNEVKRLMMAIGPLPDSAEMNAEIAAWAREMTLQEYVDLNSGDEGFIGSEFSDSGRWGRISRMQMPVWMYLNNILYRSYKIADDATLYGLPMRSLEIHETLLCACTIKEEDGETRIVYREDPLEFYPKASAYVIAKGQPLDLKGAEECKGMIRQTQKNLSEVWSVIPEFTLEADNHCIRFSTPVFQDGDADAGLSILKYVNRGQGGGADLTSAVEDPKSTYLNIVVPNENYYIQPAEVRVALVFRLGIFYKDFGSGPRWTTCHAMTIAEHLLHGAGVTLAGTKAYVDKDAGVPIPPEVGFLEILYDDGSSAMDCAIAQSEGLVVRGGTEASGEIIRIGGAGTSLIGALNRVTVRITQGDGLVETIEYAKPRPTRGFVSSKELAEKLKNEELYDGQRELQREVADLRAYAAMDRSFTPNEKSRAASHKNLTDIFRKPFGAAETDVRSLYDETFQFPEGQFGWKAGNIVWLDEKGSPSRTGSVFGGVVVMSPPAIGDSPSQFVTVCDAGTVPVLVGSGTPPGPVYATPGSAYAGSDGDKLVGVLAHHSAVPTVGESAMALVRLGAGAAASGICPFGEIIKWTTGEGETLETHTGIRGGVVICGNPNTWDFAPLEINLTIDGVWLVSLDCTVQVNRDDDGELLIPGVLTGTKPTSWTKTAYTGTENYPSGTSPVVSTGEGVIILPIGKLTVSGGGASLEKTGCGGFVIGHCAGTLSFVPRG